MSKGLPFNSFAGVIGVCIDTLHEWVKTHEEFSVAKSIGTGKLLLFDEQLALAGSSGQLKRLARVETIVDPEGNTRKIEHYEAATFAQTFTIFKFKNRYPKMYRDKIEVEATVVDSNKTSEVIEKVMQNPELRDAALAIAEMLSDEKS
jgi:hypothetical protein